MDFFLKTCKFLGSWSGLTGVRFAGMTFPVLELTGRAAILQVKVSGKMLDGGETA